jgi:type IV secretory pathway protease TraF
MAPALEKIALFAGIAAVAVTVNVNLPLHLDHVDTPSMKMGWYWVTPGATVHRGDVVTACPSSRYARWAYAVRLHSGPVLVMASRGSRSESWPSPAIACGSMPVESS